MFTKFKEKCKRKVSSLIERGKLKIQCAWKYSGYTLKWWLCGAAAFALGNTARWLCDGQNAVTRIANETWRSRAELVGKSKVPVDQPIVEMEITDDVEDAFFTEKLEEGREEEEDDEDKTT